MLEVIIDFPDHFNIRSIESILEFWEVILVEELSLTKYKCFIPYWVYDENKHSIISIYLISNLHLY